MSLKLPIERERARGNSIHKMTRNFMERLEGRITASEPIPDFVVIIWREFGSRVKKNPSYTQRSFARDLKLTSGNLSRILSGKRILSVKTAGKLVVCLGLPPESKETFLRSVACAKLLRKANY